MEIFHYWGLRENPFTNTFSLRFFYNSLQHREALERMFLVATNPDLYLGLLTGEVGTGKTLISRVLQVKLKNKSLVLYFPNAFSDIFQIVNSVSALMLKTLLKDKMNLAKIEKMLRDVKSKKKLFYIFQECLKKYVKYYKKNITIIIDECQKIDKNNLLELKGITNYLVEFKPVISIILIGQKEISSVFKTTEELKSRLSIVYSLKGLNLNETNKYILHRLQVVGGKKSPFSNDAIVAIHEYTKGKPREINKVCMLALQCGALNKLKYITGDTIFRIFADQYGML